MRALWQTPARPIPPHRRALQLGAAAAATTALALAALVIIGEQAAAQGGAAGPWPQVGADAGDARQALGTAPDDPGLRWFRDLAEVSTDEAPDGYRIVPGESGTRRPRFGPDGKVLLQAENVAAGEERLIALDPATGEVAWEAADWRQSTRQPCYSATDDQGRIWAHNQHEPGIAALDPATGEVDEASVLDEPDDVVHCDSTSLHLGGDPQRLAVFNDIDEEIGVYTLAGDAPELAWRLSGEDADAPFDELVREEFDRVATFTDGSLLVPAAQHDENGERERVEVLELALDDGSVQARAEVEMFPNESGEADLDDVARLSLLVSGDTLVVGVDTRTGAAGSGNGSVGAYDLAGGLAPDPTWEVHLEGSNGVERMALGDGVVVVAADDEDRLRTFDLASGEESALIDEGVFGRQSGRSFELATDAAGGAVTLLDDDRDEDAERQIGYVDATGALQWVFNRREIEQAAGLAHDSLEHTGTLLATPMDDEGAFLVGQDTQWALIDDSGGLGVEPASGVELGDPGVARVDGFGSGEPRDVAIELCQHLRDDDGAERIALARDDEFADALAGAGLPGISCILFTPGGPNEALHPDVRAEIDRVLFDRGEIFVLGGEQAVSGQVTDELSADGYQIARIFGPTRYETAEEIARAIIREIGIARAEDVILAQGNDWADAITAGAYAAEGAWPVLLTPPPTHTPSDWDLHPAAARVLDEMGQAEPVARTWVVGGTAAVSDAAAQATPNPQRVSGPIRHATAVQVASQMWPQVDDFADDRYITVNLEHDRGWVLALAATRLSAQWAAPQLGLRVDNFPPETRDYLTGRFDELPAVGLLGDVGFVSAEVADELRDSIEPGS